MTAVNITLPAGPGPLLQFVAQRVAVPFVWGRSDCAIFAFDAVLALTGHDVVADLRNTYSSAWGALRLLARHGGLAGLASARLGPDSAPLPGTVALLRPGWVQADEPATGALGVVITPNIVVAQGATGLVGVPVAAVQQAWQLPAGVAHG